MTRRLVDSAQNILVCEEDCETLHFEFIDKNKKKDVFEEGFEEKLYGKMVAEDVK